MIKNFTQKYSKIAAVALLAAGGMGLASTASAGSIYLTNYTGVSRCFVTSQSNTVVNAGATTRVGASNATSYSIQVSMRQNTSCSSAQVWRKTFSGGTSTGSANINIY